MKRVFAKGRYANVASTMALVIALGGTSYAAVTLPKNSVGSTQIKSKAVKNADLGSNAVTSGKVKNDTLTGRDIGESTLGKVPSAAHADGATSATTAGAANTANTATKASSADDLPDLAYQPLALINGWTGSAFGGRPAAIALDAQGTVHLRGALSQTGTFNSTPFVLPAAARPDANVWIAVDLCNANNGRLEIDTAGNVLVEGGPGVVNATIQCFVSLDGVSFDAGGA